MRAKFYAGLKQASLFLAVMAVSAIYTPAMANLSITPTILVIEGRDRFADVHLVNPTDVTNSYEIHWRFFRMEEDTGKYIESDKSVTDWDLTKHIVFTPKRMSIEPNVAQKVRLGLRLGGEPPPPGDYRAHLEFMKVPDPIPPVDLTKPEGATNEGKASVGVAVNVGFSIPVIYRVGESDATAKIESVTTRLNKGSGHIEVVVPIVKSKSAYGIDGNLKIIYNDKTIGEVKNANIFSEINKRTFVVPVTLQSMSGGTLKVIYSDFDTKKNLIFDQKSVSISK